MTDMKRVGRIVAWCALLLVSLEMTAQKDVLLDRVLTYPDSLRRAQTEAGHGWLPTDTLMTNVYTNYHAEVVHRNATMLAVPDMFHLGHGEQRDYQGEMYSTVSYTDRGEVGRLRHVHVSNVRHRRRVVPDNVRPMLSPDIYGVTLIDGHVLSPFHAPNRRFYRYTEEPIDSALTLIRFRPKRKNTQLVRGEATMERVTGRLLKVRIAGEYDMASFVLYVTMGQKGRASLRPERCDADVTLRFLGNKIHANFLTVSNLPVTLPPTIVDVDSMGLMDEVRPQNVFASLAADTVSLSLVEEESQLEQPEQATENRKDVLKEMADDVWDVIQDNMLSRIHAGFGDAERYDLCIGPIFNPLYFDYSRSRGLIYRTSMSFMYRPTLNKRLLWEVNGGYSFKQRQIYFDMPLTWHFNLRRDGFVRAELANGNHISSSDVLDRVKELHRGDTIDFDRMNLDYFRNLTAKLTVGHALSRYLSLETGLVYHRRSAVHPEAFTQVGEPSVYRTFATLLELRWKPGGERGPVLTADYEQAIPHVLGSHVRYARLEFDAAYVKPLACTRTLSLRGGVGFYMSKGNERYFLDYTHFRRNNIPSGWRDEYTGEFELLHTDWYNASDYYVRSNVTYESPMLLFSYLPWAGRMVERERIYFSALAVRNYFPFVEFGYGFTSRLCSVATFFGFSPHGYEGFGFRFGFELFHDW